MLQLEVIEHNEQTPDDYGLKFQNVPVYYDNTSAKIYLNIQSNTHRRKTLILEIIF